MTLHFTPNHNVESMLNQELNHPTDPSSEALRNHREAEPPLAFAIRDLSVLAYANGFTLWHYKTSWHNINAPGFFDAASDMMAVGDLIMATGADGARIRVVTSVKGGRVVVAALT